MATASIEVITAAQPLRSLPVTLEQRTSPVSLAIVGSFIIAAGMALLSPFALVAVCAAVSPMSFAATIGQPIIALQLGLALVLGSAFVAIPLRLLLRRVLQPHQITITQHWVSAAAGSMRTAPAWAEPLTSYRGIAHHIRTSLSGAQHEIVLVHAESSKSVVLQVADRIAQPEIDALATLLNLPQVPARTMYDRRGRSQHRLPRLPEIQSNTLEAV